ncbi:MAG: hypothetical protein R6U94_12360 [Nitriliruptoraceae bacterium]
MNLFVAALVDDPTRSESVERAILAAHERTSPFAGASHAVATWRRGHVVVASFSVHAAALAIGSYHHETGTSFDTFTGLPRLTAVARGRPWGLALAEARARGVLDPDSLGGVWTLVHARDDHLEVRSSLTGSETVAIARRPGLVLVSNRAVLARAAAWPDQPLAFDTDALIPLCARGWMAHDRLPFTGLTALPPGSALRVAPSGSQIRRTHHLDAALDEVRSGGPAVAGPEVDVDEVGSELSRCYDRIAEEMISAAREVGALGPTPTLQLAGDLATRLSAAAYHAAGVEVIATTTGQPDGTDAAVAAGLAEDLGLEHRVAPAGVQARDLPELLRRQVLFGEGLSNVYEPAPPLRAVPSVEVVRHAAGALLGGYDNLASGPRQPVTDLDEGQRFLDALTLHNGALVLREDARIAQQQVNRRIAEELLDEVGRLSFHELAYLRLREGRANGADRQAAAYGAVQVAPLLDDRVLTSLAAIPLEHKRQQRAVFELIERLAPVLNRRPLVGARLRFEAAGPVPWFAPDRWAARAPLPAPEPDAGWRVTADGKLPGAMVRRLDQQDPLLDEIIDRGRLQATLRASGPRAPRDVRSLYGVATAQQLFSGRWLEPPRGRRRGRPH